MYKATELNYIALILVLLQASSSNGANILALFTSQSQSHLIVEMSIAKTLAERGHNVTVVLSQEPVVNHERIRKIIIPITEARKKQFHEKMIEYQTEEQTLFSFIHHLFGPNTPDIDAHFDVVVDPRFKALYTTPDTKFDLLIMGYFFNDFQLGVAAKFKCPVMLSWSGPSNELTDSIIGNPREEAYVPPMIIGVKNGGLMSMKQRVISLFGSMFFRLLRTVFQIRLDYMYNQLFAEEKNFPTLDEMQRNVTLLFLNSHFSEGPVRPNVPALVEIGGIQIKDKPAPLPEDIAQFLDNSKENGAILFSLGSLLKGSNIEQETLETIFGTLASLKQNVICKWDDLDHVPNNASNILYKQWLPQEDVLAHPNVKLFITHAGKGGITEALYHAVPMVALPVFGDQQGNAEKLALNGFGIALSFKELNALNFKQAIVEVLTNPAYARNVKQFSVLYKDRPMAAKETVIYWTEYVLRHHGARHLQSPVVHMSIIQTAYLDVILIAYLAWSLLKFAIKVVYYKLFGNGKSTSKTGTPKKKKTS